jgi:hypothetical protein
VFFTFKQNNSDGYFEQDVDRGIGYAVVIEADSEAEAIRRAKTIGIEFGVGCRCCGARWTTFLSDGPCDVPTYAEQPLSEREPRGSNYLGQPPIYVHYKNRPFEVYPY